MSKRELSALTMYSTLKNVFTVLCATITLFMIYQLFVTFVVKKPTTSSKEEKEHEITDLPKVAICMEHGFNNVTLKNTATTSAFTIEEHCSQTAGTLLVGMEKEMITRLPLKYWKKRLFSQKVPI